jgi:hypothetical protein
MLNKASLKDMKAHNRRLILESVMMGREVSRISIARTTSLSPSTVTGLVSELIEEGLFIESGITISTGGRSRKELRLNPDYGRIAVVEISREQTNLCVYDMSLQKIEENLVARHRMFGNSLFSEISEALLERFFRQDSPPLLGVGLLYMEDMIQSDLKVMYSTSISSDAISLRDALYTRFKVPVVGEYSANEVLAVPLNQAEIKNSAHIAISNAILVSITLDGVPLKMKGNGPADILETLPIFDPPDIKNKGQPAVLLFHRIAGILAVLSGLFSLDLIFLSGQGVRRGNFMDHVREALGRLPKAVSLPPIQILDSSGEDISENMAFRMRNIVLSTEQKPG